MSKFYEQIEADQEFRDKEIEAIEPKQTKVVSNYPEGINRFNPPWND